MNRSTKTTWTTLIALPLLLGFVIVADSPPVSAKTVLQDDAILFSCGQFPGRATRRFRVDEHGNPDLQIDVSNAPAGPYSVIIDGIDRGVLQVNALGNGQIEYDTSPGPGQLLLNFPLTIDSEIHLLFNGTTLAFSLSNDSACQNAGGTTSSSTSTSTSSTSTSTSLDSSSSTTTTTRRSTSSRSRSIPPARSPSFATRRARACSATRTASSSHARAIAGHDAPGCGSRPGRRRL